MADRVMIKKNTFQLVIQFSLPLNGSDSITDQCRINKYKLGQVTWVLKSLNCQNFLAQMFYLLQVVFCIQYYCFRFVLHVDIQCNVLSMVNLNITFNSLIIMYMSNYFFPGFDSGMFSFYNDILFFLTEFALLFCYLEQVLI